MLPLASGIRQGPPYPQGGEEEFTVGWTAERMHIWRDREKDGKRECLIRSTIHGS